MSGDTPFARDTLASDIGLDGEGEAVEEMLRGTYTLDETGMDEIHASAEMKHSLAALKIPIFQTTNGPTPTMEVGMTLENYFEVFNKTHLHLEYIMDITKLPVKVRYWEK